MTKSCLSTDKSSGRLRQRNKWIVISPVIYESTYIITGTTASSVKLTPEILIKVVIDLRTFGDYVSKKLKENRATGLCLSV